MLKFITSLILLVFSLNISSGNDNKSNREKHFETKKTYHQYEDDKQLSIRAEMFDKDGSTISDIEGQSLSAPAEIHFYPENTEDATVFYVWQIYKASDPENAIVRYMDEEIKYTFKEADSYTVNLETSDVDGKILGSVSMKFSITNFDIKIPNYIILDGTHQFKVKSQSALNFKCIIFNRWGNKIYEFRDPSLGWDGRHNGRLVSTGVYYYVITAETGTGKKEVKRGYINALRPK